jgi:hypothetical protein
VKWLAAELRGVAGSRAGQLKPVQGPASTATTGGYVPNFTGRAQRSPPPFTPYRERASVKALALPALRPRSYRSTLSSTQMLPDSSAMVKTSLSWVSESPTGGIHRGIISRGPSKLDT